MRTRLRRPVVRWAVLALLLEWVIQGRAPVAKWVTLLPLVPMLMFLFELARSIRKMDELQQRISLVSMAIAFILTLALTLVFMGLERAGVWTPPWNEIGTYMLLLWAAVYFVSSWRYR